MSKGFVGIISMSHVIQFSSSTIFWYLLHQTWSYYTWNL